jgi:N-acetylmuramoyl-L-alanine amidase
MAISSGFITGITKQPLIHKGGVQPSPRLLVIHYSVTDTVAAAVSALNARKLSYHILVEKSGKAFQTRPFTETAAHPGRSNWKAASGVREAMSVQSSSIGICLMNMGFDHGPRPNAPGRLIYNPKDASMDSWEIYPPPQLKTCLDIARDVIATYPILEVVGHHDIAIMGKFDPGPLFDFGPLKAMLAAAPDLGFKTTVKRPGGTLPLREERDPGGKVLKNLAHGATLHVRSVAYGPPPMSLVGAPSTPASKAKRWVTAWASVDIDGSNRHAGFVHMIGLAASPLHPSLAANLSSQPGP